MTQWLVGSSVSCESVRRPIRTRYLKITLSGKNAQLLSLNTLNVTYVNFRLLFVYRRVFRVYALNGRQSEISWPSKAIFEDI